MEEAHVLLDSLRERVHRGEILNERDTALLLILEQGSEEADGTLTPAVRARLSMGGAIHDDDEEEDAIMEDEPPEQQQQEQQTQQPPQPPPPPMDSEHSEGSMVSNGSERVTLLENRVALLLELLLKKSDEPRKRLPRVESVADAPKFSGEGTGVAIALSSWIWAIREWLDDFDLRDEKDRVKYATKALTGAARDWWQRAKKELEIDTLDELFKQLRLFFQVGDVARDARHAYYRWKQMTTGQAYVQSMQRLLLEINRPEHKVPMAIADQVEIFVLGLKKEYYDEVVKSSEYRLPGRTELTLQKIFRLVTSLDSSLGRAAQQKPGAPGRTQETLSGAGGTRDPTRFKQTPSTKPLFTPRNLTKMNAIAREAGSERAERFYQLMASKFDRPVADIKTCMQTGACFAKDCSTAKPHTFGSDECSSSKKRNSGLNSVKFASVIASVKDGSDASH